jgi:flagellar biogenesis protein FliO
MDSQTKGLGVEKEDEHSKAAAAMRADQIFLSLIFFLLLIVGRVCSMFRLQC